MNTNVSNREFTLIERYMIRRFHPRRILMDVAGLPWAVYFLWTNKWQWAVLAMLVSGIFGMLATNSVDAKDYGRTMFGKMALLHLHPTNIIVQFSGIAVLVWALWTHSTPGVLAGLSIVFLGHMVGWDAVLAENTAAGFAQKAA
jgi:hypothetical protein